MQKNVSCKISLIFYVLFYDLGLQGLSRQIQPLLSVQDRFLRGSGTAKICKLIIDMILFSKAFSLVPNFAGCIGRHCKNLKCWNSFVHWYNYAFFKSFSCCIICNNNFSSLFHHTDNLIKNILFAKSFSHFTNIWSRLACFGRRVKNLESGNELRIVWLD